MSLPPNPFDNPLFREEFRKELQPVSELLVAHDREIHNIKGVGTAVSIFLLGIIAWFKR